MNQQPQRPQGIFLTDTIDVGQPFRYALSLRHPPAVDALFPDTSRHFSPFLVRDVTVFTTVTDPSGSLDSVVYTLVSFETRSAQPLRVPVFAVRPSRDCTALWSNWDTVRLRERVQTTRSDTLRLATDTAVVALRQQMNYPLLLLILLGLTGVGSVVYLLFGKTINRQLRLYRFYRQHQDFERSFRRLTRGINPDTAPDNAGKALILWKEYLEWLEKRPFSTMTTREIADAMLDDRLSDALKEVDGVIYGGVYSDQTQTSLRVLRELAERSYQQRRQRLVAT